MLPCHMLTGKPGFGRLAIYSQHMEQGGLEMLPSPRKPLAHPLSNAAVTHAILIKIGRQRWLFPATAAAAALAILTQIFLGTVPPPQTLARHCPIQGTPLPHCRRPTSSVLPISNSSRAHTSPWSLPFPSALSSSKRSAGRKVVAALGGAWEGS